MSLRQFDEDLRNRNSFSGYFKDNFFTDSLMRRSDYRPAANVQSLDDRYEIQLALPGYKRESINLSVDQNILTIEAEEIRRNEINENYTRREFYQSSFQRSFSLPDDVNEDKIEATFKDGVLIISIGRHDHDPKVRQRKIEIK
ncbi:Hsp20/alpha crystallin family protein [Owenweeksia hongkongensis]|uniref:Hsp20/alpha crystallin family protein n=1 Tax=Owenweeksia hongkongensis TaxID=253245 RepID=UPI003A90E89A